MITAKSITLADYAKTWLADRALKPRTCQHYQGLLDHEILTVLGARCSAGQDAEPGADPRDDIRAECAGAIAGAWFASPGTHYGHELIAHGLLLVSGPVDTDLLKQWLREGYERGQAMWLGYGRSS